MKETGLMFKAPLVRAILEGRKTQTRRVVKRLPLRINGDTNSMEVDVANIENGNFAKKIRCPYGQPGDRIYVRETFSQHPEWGQLAFRADGEEFEDADGWLWEPKWQPSSQMPKKLARIWLEITGVRVKRLQDISTEDCISEGLNTTLREYDAEVNLRDQFQELWESTGGDWDANPWVWVIDFRVLSTTGRPA